MSGLHIPPARKLHRFPGGVRLPGNKAISTERPSHGLPLAGQYVVPLRQHIGTAATPLVRRGDHVLKGQRIGLPQGPLSAAVHAPTSGKVLAVERRPVPHPSGLSDLCVVIVADGRDESVPMTPVDWSKLEPAALRQLIRDQGLVGLGGAVFPSHVKLEPPPGRPIHTLILNGAECEPWITCDDRLMRDHAAEILEGVAVMRHLLDAGEILVGIEDNKPEAIAAMRWAAAAMPFPIVVVALPSVYPAGGGKQLTYTLTGRETPSGGLTTDIGVQVFNVGTAHALYRLLNRGEPLISRLVTVTGHVLYPGNYEVRLGTPVRDLLRAAGGVLRGASGLIVGGPMMGFELVDDHAPVVKGVNCILVKDPDTFPPPPPPLPCIRCGECARVCPVELQPFEMYWYSRARDFGKAQAYKLFDCIECGCCSHACPSHIPLVSYFRYAKSEIWAREHEKQASDRAREQHEFHQFRLEREKREKAEKLGKKAGERIDSIAADDPEAARKQAILQAAIERARQAREATPARNTDNLTPEQQREIAEIERRREATARPAPSPQPAPAQDAPAAASEATAAAPGQTDAASSAPPLEPVRLLPAGEPTPLLPAPTDEERRP